MKKRTKAILEEFNFERMKVQKEKCICYQQDKKCHDIKSLNCYFCYCPYYGDKCKIDSPFIKYVTTSLGKKILDCSDCNFPHIEKNIIRMIEEKRW